MAFNDSFGPLDGNNNEEENKNNNISFEENKNNNMNNISFEDNKNNNNVSFEENKNNNMSFDDMKINNNNNVEEEKQNDIFNSLPMEIQRQDNQELLYYQNLHITENIKHNLFQIFNFINKRIYLNKIKFFYELKYRADYKYSKLVEAEMIFMNIQNKLNTFNYIERLFRYKLLKESFIYLKKYIKLNKYKEEQDKIKETEMKKKIKEVNDTLKKNEKNLKDISDTVDKLKNNEKNLNNDISELNKKYNKLDEKYNNLLQKSKTLKENIKQKASNYSLTLDKTIDPKIAELQNIIKNKEKEKENSLNYFEEFYLKMSDMLGMYESQYEAIKSKLNLSGATNI